MSFQQVGQTSGTTAALTSASSVVLAGSLVVAVVNVDSNAAASVTGTVTSSDGGTWTERAHSDPGTNGTGNGATTIWTMSKAATGAVTVTSTLTSGFTAGNQHSFVVYTVNEVVAVGATGAGYTTTNNSSPALFTATGNYSLYVVGCTDWTAPGAPASSDLNPISTFHSATFMSAMAGARRGGADSGTSVTANLDAGGTAAVDMTWAAIEVTVSGKTGGAVGNRRRGPGYRAYRTTRELGHGQFTNRIGPATLTGASFQPFRRDNRARWWVVNTFGARFGLGLEDPGAGGAVFGDASSTITANANAGANVSSSATASSTITASSSATSSSANSVTATSSIGVASSATANVATSVTASSVVTAASSATANSANSVTASSTITAGASASANATSVTAAGSNITVVGGVTASASSPGINATSAVTAVASATANSANTVTASSLITASGALTVGVVSRGTATSVIAANAGALASAANYVTANSIIAASSYAYALYDQTTGTMSWALVPTATANTDIDVVVMAGRSITGSTLVADPAVASAGWTAVTWPTMEG